MWYVYILKSIKNGSLYIGSTNNLERRFWEHNNSIKKNSFTYKNRPYILMLSEKFLTKIQSAQREKYLKTGKGREELIILISKATNK